jgi:hypothetical protein
MPLWGLGGNRPSFPRQGKSLPSPVACGLEVKARGPGESRPGGCFSVPSYLSASGRVAYSASSLPDAPNRPWSDSQNGRGTPDSRRGGRCQEGNSG